MLPQQLRHPKQADSEWKGFERADNMTPPRSPRFANTFDRTAAPANRSASGNRRHAKGAFARHDVTAFLCTITPSTTRQQILLARPARGGNDAGAQNELGLAYAEGADVGKNEAEAVKWYRKAAEQGDAPAQYNLGVMYGEGRGVGKDEAEAAKWYRKAAEQGYPNAQSVGR